MSSPRATDRTEGDDLRADAERNRRRIVAAAAAVFGEQGLDAPLEEVARRAGVGIATLYRRYPSREGLVVACFRHRLDEYAAALDEALAAPDAWTGFCGFVEGACEMQAADRATQDLLTTSFPTAREVEAQRAREYARFTELVRRAQREGGLRPDFVTEDFVLLLMANAGVVRATREAAPGAWRRFVALMLDGFRAETRKRDQPLPCPPSPAQTFRAMRRLQRPRQMRDDTAAPAPRPESRTNTKR
jgi:AcrR family transcriptional regulator